MGKRKKVSHQGIHFHPYLTWIVLLFLIVSFFAVFYPALAAKGGAGRKPGTGASPSPNGVPIPVPPPTSGELLQNPSFEVDNDNDSVPDGWTHHYDQPNKNSGIVCNVAHSGSCSFYIPGLKHTAIKQYVPVNLPAGTKVTISGYSRAENVTLDQGPSTGSYWVQAWIHYANGSTEYGFVANFNTGTHNFELTTNSKYLTAPVEGFTFFAKQAMDGNVWFDDVSLRVE